RRVRGRMGARPRRDRGGEERGARAVPRAADRAPGPGRALARLGGGRRRPAAHARRLPVPGPGRRRDAADRSRDPGSGRRARTPEDAGKTRLQRGAASTRVTRRPGESTFVGKIDVPDPERLRLGEDARRRKNWKRWGPYLSERQWGTVREDY